MGKLTTRYRVDGVDSPLLKLVGRRLRCKEGKSRNDATQEERQIANIYQYVPTHLRSTTEHCPTHDGEEICAKPTSQPSPRRDKYARIVRIVEEETWAKFEGKQQVNAHGRTGLLVGSTTFSRIPFSIGCHSPTDNNRFRGSLDCVLNAWQVEACYAKSVKRGRREGKKEKEKERETETDRQTRRLCLRHPASRQERISFLYPSPLFFCHGNSKCCISARTDKTCDLSRLVDFHEEN